MDTHFTHYRLDFDHRIPAQYPLYAVGSWRDNAHGLMRVRLNLVSYADKSFAEAALWDGGWQQLLTFRTREMLAFPLRARNVKDPEAIEAAVKMDLIKMSIDAVQLLSSGTTPDPRTWAALGEAAADGTVALPDQDGELINLRLR